MLRFLSCALLLAAVLPACTTKEEAVPASEAGGTETAPAAKNAAAKLDFSPGGPISDADLGSYLVKMDCSIGGEDAGSMTFEFWPEKAPKTVRNFLRYASEGFYDGLTFHRIIPGFMIQGGDPSGNGTGSGPHGNIPAEFSSDPKYSHVYGVLSMARGPDPGSASCQFFICNANPTHLDGKYASFGKMLEGRETLDKLSSVALNGSKPLRPVVMEKVAVIPKAN